MELRARTSALAYESWITVNLKAKDAIDNGGAERAVKGAALIACSEKTNFARGDFVYLCKLLIPRKKDGSDLLTKKKYLNGDYEIGRLDEHGQRIDITITVDSRTKKGIKLVTGWMIRPLGKITCNTPLGG